MIASLRAYGTIARAILSALVGALVLATGATTYMAMQARSSATEAVVQQAWSIAQGSLTLAFTPDDLADPVSPERAAEISAQMQAIVVDPSPFDDVTVYSPDAEILYSTHESLISSDLPGQKDAIREAMRGTARVTSGDGTVGVIVPLRLPSGVGEDAAVELTRPDDVIRTAPGPWRNATYLLLGLLVMLLLVTWIIGRVVLVGKAEEARETARPLPKAATPAQASRPVTAPQPGLREESEARRRAEDRATAAEERLATVQAQYRKALDDIRDMERASAVGIDPRMEERALRAEGKLQTAEQQVATLMAERERLGAQLRDVQSAGPDPDQEYRLRAAEREATGLRLELEGAQEELGLTRRELEVLRAQAARSTDAQRDAEVSQSELQQTREALRSSQAEVTVAQRELDDARREIRALRTEEQRATMFEDELRAARAESASLRASQRAELVEREAEFEEKVRATREEFQRQIEALEASYKGQVAQREAELAGRIAKAEITARDATRELETVRAEMEAAKNEAAGREQRVLQTAEELGDRRSEIAALQAEITERTMAVTQARKEAEELRHMLVGIQADATERDALVGELQAELIHAQTRSDEAIDALTAADRDRAALSERVEKLNTMLEAAAAETAELNRRAQDSEARRQLELASDQGRAEIDELLKVTQERLAGQTEKLIAAEDRVRDLETQVQSATERMEVMEGELRTHQMSEALREMRAGEVAAAEPGVAVPVADDAVIEDRRATTPFLQELSMDAKKSMARINGIAQLLKHRRDAKEQTQLVKQLAAYARRLDATVADLTDAERLVRGTIELQVRRADVGAIAQRVIDESGIGADHEVHVAVEPLTIRVDPARTEQILLSLLRNADDRTNKGITVRLQSVEGGGLLSVEDPETSSDASMSPVVKRLAELMGGWARVEGRDGGGSSFKVFLPDAEAIEPAERPDEPSNPALRIVVDEPETADWPEPNAEQILSQELRRLAEQESAGSPKSGSRRGRR
jgi:signal transduction histidine kinase